MDAVTRVLMNINLDLREMQIEAAKALSYYLMDNNTMSKYNKKVNHDSHNFYKAVINEYIKEFGGLPSQTGPAKEVKLVLDNV